jgi:hypothetical protein
MKLKEFLNEERYDVVAKEMYEVHDKIERIIRKHGESFDKRHGNWVRLHFDEDLWFTLDTWNSAVTLVKGSGEPTGAGFRGEKVHYFGMNFGGRTEADLTLGKMKWYLNVLEARFGKINESEEGIKYIVFGEGMYNLSSLPKRLIKEHNTRKEAIKWLYKMADELDQSPLYFDIHRIENGEIVNEAYGDGRPEISDYYDSYEFVSKEPYDKRREIWDELTDCIPKMPDYDIGYSDMVFSVAKGTDISKYIPEKFMKFINKRLDEVFDVNNDGLSYEAIVVFNRRLKKAEQEIAKAIGYYWGRMPYVSLEGAGDIEFRGDNSIMVIPVDLTKTASDDPGFHDIENKLGDWIEQGTPKRKDGTQKWAGLGKGIVKTVGVDYP